MIVALKIKQFLYPCMLFFEVKISKGSYGGFIFSFLYAKISLGHFYVNQINVFCALSFKHKVS